jgi:hypothetical protein
MEKTLMTLAAALTLLIGAGCTQISLKRLDQDIPSALVEKYNSTENEYVDTGTRYFPIPFLSGKEHVAKTDRGFQAYQHKNYALLLADTTKQADFDRQGQLLRYAATGSFLTPIIYSERSEKIRIRNEIREDASKKILLGCLGTQTTMRGDWILTVLWVPCPIPMYEEPY